MDDGANTPRVALVTGIFPPDIGGPATHARDVYAEFVEAGTPIFVLTLTDRRSKSRCSADTIIRWPRWWPWPLRGLALVTWLYRNRSRYDVVYATGMQAEAAVGGLLARRPVVVKVVGDPAWERLRRLDSSTPDFDQFQSSAPTGVRDAAMRALRSWWVRRAASVVAPSHYLAELADAWGARPRTSVVPNAVRGQTGERRNHAKVSPTVHALYVGRLVAHKRVDVIVKACALSGTALTIVGDGPERSSLEALIQRLGSRSVRLVGPRAHDEVMQLMREADVLVNAASYEGLPHTIVEALATGTPVVASPAGGTAEVVISGVNGIIVDPPTEESFAAVLAHLAQNRLELQRLAAGAGSSGSAAWESSMTSLRTILAGAVQSRPKAAFFGKTTVAECSDPRLERYARHLDALVIAVGSAKGTSRREGVKVISFPAFRPRLVSTFVYVVGGAPLAVLAAGRRGAVVCQSPHYSFIAWCVRALLPRPMRPRIVVEIHGDWRTATRHYGSGWRRLLNGPADRAAIVGIRQADRLRAISKHTAALALSAGWKGPIDVFPTFTASARPVDDPVPLPAVPLATYVGALERVKGPDVLLRAWPGVRQVVEGAAVRLVGGGSAEPDLRTLAADVARNAEFISQVPQEDVGGLIDQSWCIVVPSRSEGLGRIAMEAAARGRAVVCSDVGGLPEVVQHDVTGLVVPPEDEVALRAALIRLLSDRQLATRMGVQALRRASAHDPAAEFDRGTARLAQWLTVG